jgi:hypothetical protein
MTKDNDEIGSSLSGIVGGVTIIVGGFLLLWCFSGGTLREVMLGGILFAGAVNVGFRFIRSGIREIRKQGGLRLNVALLWMGGVVLQVVMVISFWCLVFVPAWAAGKGYSWGVVCVTVGVLVLLVTASFVLAPKVGKMFVLASKVGVRRSTAPTDSEDDS